jgi:trk system potassium uptake protein
MPRVAVIGLGRFGTALARRLGSSGVQVIAVDRNTHLVGAIKDDVDLAVALDSTDETALVSQEIDRVDVCVVAIGENFEAALLTTVIAKRLKIPKVVCRAQTAFHAEIFRQIGADDVIQPEIHAGEALARRLTHPQIQDFISLADGYTIVELLAPSAFRGRSVKAIGLRAKYRVNLVAIKRTTAGKDHHGNAEEQESVHLPMPDDTIQRGDVLVLAGSDEDLARMPQE